MNLGIRLQRLTLLTNVPNECIFYARFHFRDMYQISQIIIIPRSDTTRNIDTINTEIISHVSVVITLIKNSVFIFDQNIINDMVTNVN